MKTEGKGHMAVTKEKKKELVDQYQKNKQDNGSPEVQISILTERINDITKHLTSNPKDYQGQRGLLMLIGKRRRQLNFLENKSTEAYRKIIDQLAIRS